MKQTCEKIMNTYLELDKNSHLPTAVTIHLLMCKKCREQVHLLNSAEKASCEPLKVQVPVSDQSIINVMKQINPAYAGDFHTITPISMKRWIISGIIMIVLMIAFGLFTSENSNPNLLLSFYLVFAAFVTSYCALFIGSNIDFFVKKIETLKINI